MMLFAWFAGLAAVLILLMLIWLASLSRRDASIVDIFWGPGFVLVASVYLGLSNGWAPRQALALVLVSLWGLRLGAHIFWRSRGREEDYRYRAMRERHGARFWWVSLFTVFLFQGLLVWLISVPLLQAIRAGQPARWTAFDLAAVVLFVVGFLFETVGDLQLARFRSNPACQGKVLRTGLWRYTRHPNYFGDALVWWSFFVLALGTSGSLWTIYSPVVMTFLLLKVSGVGLLEKKLSQTRSEYADYVATTNAFVPWFPRIHQGDSMRSFSILMFMTLLLSTSGAAEPAEPADWNQWRGPERDGSVAGNGWPSSLDGLEPVWTVELGKGYPGPLVAGDRVFVVETFNKKSVAVRALGLTDGKELWTTRWDASGSVPFFAATNGDWVRSTPVWDGASLYVGDMQERVVALDGATGEIRWTVDFPERFGTAVPDFGFASSPLIDADALYVQAANSIVKLDRATGKTIWRALESSGKIKESGAFSSPVIETLAGVRQLVVLTRHTLHGIALDDGRELWSQGVPNFRGMNILTPVFDGDRVFTSAYQNGSFLFELSLNDGSWVVAEKWKHPGSGYMSSPVLIDGFVYLHLGNGRVSCMNLSTGEEQWRSESFGKYWSMLWQGDKILALDERGELMLLRANPERFELLDRKTVTDREAWGYLAIHGDLVFVRDLESIRAFRWSATAAAARG
jgi:steroid 5-alpha reductase family enzyme/outer membrane protein assembly factor BamB